MKAHPQKVSHVILREMQHQTMILEDIRKQTRKIQGTITAVILFLIFACGGIMILAMLADSSGY